MVRKSKKFLKKVWLLGSVVIVGSFLATSNLQPQQISQTLDILLGEGQIIQEINGEEELKGEFHRWEPEGLVVNLGDLVTLRVRNPRSRVHSFVLPAFGIDTGSLAARSGRATVQFLADRAGTFQFICGEVACELDHVRQVGYLTVLKTAISERVPKSIALAQSAISPGDSLTLTIGNGSDVTLDVKFTVTPPGGSPGAVQTASRWVTLDGTGTATLRTDRATAAGQYTITEIKNAWNATWVPVSAALTVR